RINKKSHGTENLLRSEFHFLKVYNLHSPCWDVSMNIQKRHCFQRKVILKMRGFGKP
ncbi:unnamed protein product, partial [Allacma fusca]